MGRLLFMRDFSKEAGCEDPSWWFPDAYHWSSSSSSMVRFDHRKVFPHRSSVHRLFLGKSNESVGKPHHNALRVTIRKFIERQCGGNAISTYEPLNYYYSRQVPEDQLRDKSWEETGYRKIKIRHGFWHFDFEDECDVALFRLRFGEFIRPYSERHFGHPDVTEEQIERAKDWKLHRSNLPDWAAD